LSAPLLLHLWEPGAMPWAPELFSAPALQQLLDQRRIDALVSVPYFDGVLSEEPDAMVESFVGEPEVHDPVRGRVKGVHAFKTFVAETKASLTHRNVVVEDVERIILARRGFEEVVVHLDGDAGRIDLPVAIVTDHSAADGRLDELRVYSSSWPLTGHHAIRPPLLQPDPEVRPPDVVAAYLQSLASGDVDSVVATFEPDGYVRQPEGTQYVHRGPDALRSGFSRMLADGGVSLEQCALADDGRVCALEYNVVRWGRLPLRPQAGVAMFTRGPSGKLAAVRRYDDAEPQGVRM
jgi:hypothetical protein